MPEKEINCGRCQQPMIELRGTLMFWHKETTGKCPVTNFPTPEWFEAHKNDKSKSWFGKSAPNSSNALGVKKR